MSIKSVEDLFKQREDAIKTKSVSLFEETQLHELVGSISSHYLSIDAMKTTILNEVDDTPGLTKVVFVKEEYYIDNKLSHHNFLLYGIVNTIAGWKIHTITQGFFRMGPWRNKAR